MAKKNFFGLFIGVDDYQSPKVPKLKGCVNDACKMLDYLQNTLDSSLYDLHIRKLFSPRADNQVAADGLPTRANILAELSAIGNHSSLKKGDVVFIFYAGHGSTEKAHPYFKESTGELQTLVPTDARTIGADGKKVRDVLDKEIRLQIHKIWKNNHPEIIFIQDSCHSAGASRNDIEKTIKKLSEEIEEQDSKEEEVQQETTGRGGRGSGQQKVSNTRSGGRGSNPYKETAKEEKKEKKSTMRGGQFDTTQYDEQPMAARLVSGDQEFLKEERPLDEIFGLDEEGQRAFEEEANDYESRSADKRGLFKKPFEMAFPEGNHIHMSACGQQQFAYEVASRDASGKTTKGGVFTDTIVKLLSQTGGNISYHDLFQRAKTAIDGIFQQTPSIYVRGDQSKRYMRFLGQQTTKQEGTFNLVHKVLNNQELWLVDAGALLGLPVLRKNQSVPVTVVNVNNAAEKISDAYLDYVMAEASIVKFPTAQPNRNGVYQVKINLSALNPTPLKVAVEKMPVSGQTPEYLQRIEAPQLALTQDANSADYHLKLENSWLVLQKNEVNGLQEVFKVSGINLSSQEAKMVAPDLDVGVTSNVYPWAIQEQAGKKVLLRPSGAQLDIPMILQVDNKHTGPTAEAVNVINSYFSQLGQAASLYVDAPAGGDNPFMQFANLPEASYFKSFMTFLEMNQWDEQAASVDADYVVRAFAGHFMIVSPDNPRVPVVRESSNLSKLEAMKVMNYLRKIARWHNCKTLENPHPDAKKVLNGRYLDIAAADQTIRVQLDTNGRPFYKLTSIKGGAMQAFEVPQIPYKEFHSMTGASIAASLHFTFNQHLQTAMSDPNLFIGALLLGPDFEIDSVLQGNSMVFVPYNQQKGALGQKVHKLVSYPQGLMNPKERNGYGLEKVNAYLKIFLTYKRFDTADWFQDPLPMPKERIEEQKGTAASSNFRAILARKRGDGAGDWIAITIPLELTSPHGTEDDDEYK